MIIRQKRPERVRKSRSKMKNYIMPKVPKIEPISTYNHTTHTSRSNFITSYGLTRAIWDRYILPRLPEPATYEWNMYGIKFPVWRMGVVEAVFLGVHSEIEAKLAKLQTNRIAAERRREANEIRLAADESKRRNDRRKSRSKKRALSRQSLKAGK